METGTKLIIATIVAVVLLIVLIALMPFTIVSAGERAVVFHWGSVNRTLDTGLHWITPLAESVEKIDVSTQKVEDEADSSSKDLQTVHTKIALNYNVDPSFVADVWSNYKGEHQARLVDPSIQESVKAATALYTAEELITKRELVKEEIKKNLREKLTQHHLVVDEVNIVNFDFSSQFNAAIEAKVTAQQNALAAENKLQQVKFEADQRVAQATAEAEAIKIQAQAITQQGGKDYVALKYAEKWDGHLPTTMVPGTAVPFLDLKY